MRIEKKQIKFNIYILTYIFALTWSYKAFIIKKFSYYYGFIDEMNIGKAILTIVTIGILANIFYYKYIQSYYYIMSFIIFIFTFIPTGVYFYMANQKSEYYIMNFIGILLINIIGIKNRESSKSVIKSVDIKMKKNIKMLLWSILVIYVVVIIYIYMKYGFSIREIIQIDSIYEMRLSARSNLPKIATYIIPWSINAIIPMILGYGLYYNKKINIFIGIVISFMLFSIGGNKSYLINLTFVFLIYLSVKYNKTHKSIFMLGVIILMINVFGGLESKSLLIRRTFFVPANLSYRYYEFFSNNQKMNLSHSILKDVINNEYQKDPPYIIGKEFYKSEEMSANANFIADSYANFGFYGIIAYSIILGGLIRSIEYIVKDNMKELSIMSAVAFYGLTNTALPTAIMTHGLGVLVILIWIYKQLGTKNIQNENDEFIGKLTGP